MHYLEEKGLAHVQSLSLKNTRLVPMRCLSNALLSKPVWCSSLFG
jgi:hypothetical protein